MSCPVCPADCEVKLFAECQCEVCSSFGYDPQNRLLLWCDGGTWQKKSECPGGVSVACGPTDGYEITCLNSDGSAVN
jgi:hypothetical protein